MRAVIAKYLRRMANRIDRADLRYIASQGAIRPCGLEFGLSEADLHLLQHFWRPICREITADQSELRKRVTAGLQADLASASDLLSRSWPGATAQDYLVLYLMLRSNGSYPVYSVRNFPDDAASYLLSEAGNCTDHAYRVGLLCDWFGLQVRAAHFWTPSVPGHSVADVYDPVGRTAYLIDSNFNCLFFIRGAGAGFLESAMNLSTKERREMFRRGGRGRVAAPVIVHFYDPGPSAMTRGASTLTELNEAVESARARGWESALSNEFPDLLACWVSPDRKFGSVTPLRGGYRPTLSALAIGEGLSTSTLMVRARAFLGQAAD